MADRTHAHARGEIAAELSRIERRHTVRLELDHMVGSGFRLSLEGRDLSPRVSAPDLVRWLQGFAEGLELIELKVEQGRRT